MFVGVISNLPKQTAASEMGKTFRPTDALHVEIRSEQSEAFYLLQVQGMPTAEVEGKSGPASKKQVYSAENAPPEVPLGTPGHFQFIF
jgi:hypothetical protein